MQFSLTFSDISLLLAFTTMILLATSELVSSYHGEMHIFIDKRRLRIAALTMGFLFIFVAIIKTYQSMLS
jgi:hypothetical protein